MDDDLTQAAVARAQLRQLGIPVDQLDDEQTIRLWGQMLRDQIPTPAVRAGSPPVNARAWATAALTAGGFVEPEDRHQRAHLADGGPDVDLGVVGMLIMRHLNRSGTYLCGWTDAELAGRVRGGNPADFARVQNVIDQAAADTGVAATPAPRWWLGPPRR